MPAAEFLAPTTLDDAVGALGADDTHLVGGGTALTLLLKTGMLEAGRLVWLGKVAALKEVAEVDGALRIGAGATLQTIATTPLVRRHCPALATAAGLAANIRVRAVATLGGHLVHADPRQDCPPVLLATGATVRLVSAAGARTVDVDDLLVSMMETTIRPTEVLVHVDVPIDAGRREAYVRFAPGSADDFPTASAAVALRAGDGGTLESLRIGLGAVGSRATLHRPDPTRWHGQPWSPELARAVAGAVAAEIEPVADHRGSARYRWHVTGVVVERALDRAWHAHRGAAPSGEEGAAHGQ